MFLEEAKKLIVSTRNAVDLARHAQQGQSGTIRIGIASGLGGFVNRVVAAYIRRSPAINIECKDIFSTIQNEALRERKIDVGFLRPPVDLVNLDSEMRFEERFAVVLPKAHPLARRRAVLLKEIANEPLIVFSRSFSSGLHDKIAELYRKQGLTPRLTVTHAEAHEEAGTIMVAAGEGIFIGVGAIVTRSVAGADVVAVRLKEPDAKIEVHAAWRKQEASPAVFALLDSVHQVLPTHKN